LLAADSLAWRHMQKSLKSPEYARLVAILAAARHAAGIPQQKLAEKLGTPQSFVAKYEGGERRIDLIEFIAIARALDADPVKLFGDFLAGVPGPKPRRKRLAK
jgi:transcriptional regulator with XRE-family HTH domain